MEVLVAALAALRASKLATIVASLVLMNDEPPPLEAIVVMFAAPNTLVHSFPL